jgi:hypothetical protein
MTEDDISSLALDLHDFLEQLGRVPNENQDYDALYNLLSDKLAPFITKERNYN